MKGLYGMWELNVFFMKNKPQITANELRFDNRRALKPVFAPFASSAVRSEYAPQRARRAQRGEQ